MGRPRSEQADVAILDAALRQLRARGFAELSIEGVAAEAGIGKATVYRRYRNKADLASAAFASIASQQFDAAQPEGTRDALIDHMRRFERGTGEVGLDVIASLLGERSDPELLELHRERVVRRGRARAQAILRRGQERGELRADLDLDAAVEMLYGSLFARRLAGGTESDWPDAVVDTLFAGLAVPARADR